MKKTVIVAGFAIFALALSGCGKKESDTQIATMTQRMEELQSTVDSLAQEVGDLRTAQESAAQTGSQSITLGNDGQDEGAGQGTDDSSLDGSSTDGNSTDGSSANGSTAGSNKVESSQISDEKLKAINDKVLGFEQKLNQAEAPADESKKMDAFFELKKEADAIENELDTRENELESEYREKKLERKDYASLSHQLDRVEDYLDSLEDELEVKFGVAD